MYPFTAQKFSLGKRILGVISFLVLFGGFAYAVIIFGVLISQLDPQPAATILAALLGLFGVLFTQWTTGNLNRHLERERAHMNRRAEKERAHLSRRSEAYEEMVKELLTVVEIFRSEIPMYKTSKSGLVGRPSKNDETTGESRLHSMMTNFGAQALVWGSSEVLLAWNKYRIDGTRQGVSAYQKRKLLVDLIKKIRIDLGHEAEESLSDSDLLRPFINDLDENADLQR